MPIVLISGHGGTLMTAKRMKAGAIDFLAKPLREQDVLGAVATALDRLRFRPPRDHS
ncbi:response regulator [Rhizobium ruizarguesonis]|nr:response regulator [Rhizobium ruizarguesonis]